jgi:hypothetical protein
LASLAGRTHSLSPIASLPTFVPLFNNLQNSPEKCSKEIRSSFTNPLSINIAHAGRGAHEEEQSAAEEDMDYAVQFDIEEGQIK